MSCGRVIQRTLSSGFRPFLLSLPILSTALPSICSIDFCSRMGHGLGQMGTLVRTTITDSGSEINTQKTKKREWSLVLFTAHRNLCILKQRGGDEGLADKRIYTGYYKRYDGKQIYVVVLAKDVDTGEDVVIWTPFTYSKTHEYFTMSKKSFCEDVVIDGKRLAKFKRQTQMKMIDSVRGNYEAEGFHGPRPRRTVLPKNKQDAWLGIHATDYYEYAKKLCEQYRFLTGKYNLCIAEKRYIGITKKDFFSLKEDLLFVKNCMRTVLKEHSEYFEERFVKGLSIRKYAEAHKLNRGSVDHLQRKFFTALARALKERDDAEGKCRLRSKT